jgi:hypothetical protein
VRFRAKLKLADPPPESPEISIIVSGENFAEAAQSLGDYAVSAALKVISMEEIPDAVRS